MTITAVTFLYDGQCDHITPREIRSVIYNSFSEILHYLNRLYLIWLLSHSLSIAGSRTRAALPGEWAPDAAEWNIKGGMSCPGDESKRL